MRLTSVALSCLVYTTPADFSSLPLIPLVLLRSQGGKADSPRQIVSRTQKEPHILVPSAALGMTKAGVLYRGCLRRASLRGQGGNRERQNARSATSLTTQSVSHGVALFHCLSQPDKVRFDERRYNVRTEQKARE